jgi:NTE family protein
MDGGIRSATNADLAAGSSAVIVLNAIGQLTPPEPLQTELAALGAAATLVITPDNAAAAVMGTTAPSHASPSPGFSPGVSD